MSNGTLNFVRNGIRGTYMPGTGCLEAWGTSLPSNGETGYASGCRLTITGGNAGSQLYINEGSNSSSSWSRVEAGSPSYSSESLSMSGTFTAHAINLQPSATLGDYNAIRVGTWGTEAQFNDGGGLFRMYGQVGSGGTASAMIFTRALTESTTPVINAQFYTDCSAGTPGPIMLSAIDCFVVLNSGGYLAAGASWLDSMHAGWFKVQGAADSVCNGMVAPIWVDNQMSCAVAQEEFGIIATTGGTRPDGFIGFETSSSGYDQLFYFDATFNSGAGTCVTTDAVPGGNQDARIKVYYNGTQYYIPLYR